MNVTEDELTALKALVAERDGVSPVRRYEIGQELVKAVPVLIATVDRLREALTWAVGFIQCNLPNTAQQYPDMRNAQDLVLAHALPTGEFQRVSAVAELAEEQVKKLLAFKDYVHERLDEAAVSIDPESPHKAEGCRIGGRLDELIGERDRLRAAIAKHHGQRADDRCQFDDDELYAAAGLPPVDRRVGDKFAMLVNCVRFIEHRCESRGPWKSYAELLAERDQLQTTQAELLRHLKQGLRLGEIAVRQGLKDWPKEEEDDIVRNHVDLKPMRELIERLAAKPAA